MKYFGLNLGYFSIMKSSPGSL